MIEHRFHPCDPFDSSRLYGNERYSLQNMLLREVNMPSTYFEGVDKMYEVYEDCARPYFWDCAESIRGDQGGDAWWTGVDQHREVPGFAGDQGGDAWWTGVADAPFLAWATDVFSKLEGKPVKLTGACVIRYTNVSSGYPCLRLTGIEAIHEPTTRSYGIVKQPIFEFDPQQRMEYE
jgi:hypothetical protein